LDRGRAQRRERSEVKPSAMAAFARYEEEREKGNASEGVRKRAQK
jgi:hypothetical protein